MHPFPSVICLLFILLVLWMAWKTLQCDDEDNYPRPGRPHGDVEDGQTPQDD
jgi:hypothetical protein